MSFRKFEMNHYRQALSRIRLGDMDRAIAPIGLMGRGKLAEPLQLPNISPRSNRKYALPQIGFSSGSSNIIPDTQIGGSLIRFVQFYQDHIKSLLVYIGDPSFHWPLIFCFQGVGPIRNIM